MKTATTVTADIIVIDNERYLIPHVYQDGEFVKSPNNKIKLPIEITPGFHINKGFHQKPRASLFHRFRCFISGKQ